MAKSVIRTFIRLKPFAESNRRRMRKSRHVCAGYSIGSLVRVQARTSEKMFELILRVVDNGVTFSIFPEAELPPRSVLSASVCARRLIAPKWRQRWNGKTKRCILQRKSRDLNSLAGHCGHVAMTLTVELSESDLQAFLEMNAAIHRSAITGSEASGARDLVGPPYKKVRKSVKETSDTSDNYSEHSYTGSEESVDPVEESILCRKCPSLRGVLNCETVNTEISAFLDLPFGSACGATFRILAGGKTFYTHPDVLCCQSVYFKKLILRKNLEYLSIGDVDASQMRNFLLVLYDANRIRGFSKNFNALESLYRIAKKFRSPRIVRHCELALRSVTIRVDSVQKAFELAYRYNRCLAELKEASVAVMLQNPETPVAELPVRALLDVYRAALKWKPMYPSLVKSCKYALRDKTISVEMIPAALSLAKDFGREGLMQRLRRMIANLDDDDRLLLDSILDQK